MGSANVTDRELEAELNRVSVDAVVELLRIGIVELGRGRKVGEYLRAAEVAGLVRSAEEGWIVATLDAMGEVQILDALGSWFSLTRGHRFEMAHAAVKQVELLQRVGERAGSWDRLFEDRVAEVNAQG